MQHTSLSPDEALNSLMHVYHARISKFQFAQQNLTVETVIEVLTRRIVGSTKHNRFQSCTELSQWDRQITNCQWEWVWERRPGLGKASLSISLCPIQ